VGDDQALADLVQLADEAALHGGFEVDGRFVQDEQPAGLARQQGAQDKRFLLSRALPFFRR
jgi:hypothetical protein